MYNTRLVHSNAESQPRRLTRTLRWSLGFTTPTSILLFISCRADPVHISTDTRAHSGSRDASSLTWVRTIKLNVLPDGTETIDSSRSAPRLSLSSVAVSRTGNFFGVVQCRSGQTIHAWTMEGSHVRTYGVGSLAALETPLGPLQFLPNGELLVGYSLSQAARRQYMRLDPIRGTLTEADFPRFSTTDLWFPTGREHSYWVAQQAALTRSHALALVADGEVLLTVDKRPDGTFFRIISGGDSLPDGSIAIIDANGPDDRHYTLSFVGHSGSPRGTYKGRSHDPAYVVKCFGGLAFVWEGDGVRVIEARGTARTKLSADRVEDGRRGRLIHVTADRLWMFYPGQDRIHEYAYGPI